MASINDIPQGTDETVEDVPVLIVGGSLVGLTLAALLAQHGIKGCLTVDKHSSTAIHPRATVMMPRTMQIFKELGLYDTMLAESRKFYDEHTCAILTLESLAGPLLHKWLDDVNAGIDRVSATRRVFLTQQALEPLLRAKAQEFGAELRFSTEMIDFRPNADGSVTATLRHTETGSTRKVRARYMVACDGFRSFTRGKLGIPSHGPGLLSRALTIYFQINPDAKEKLARLPGARYSGVLYVANETVRAFFRFDKDKKESFLVINSAGRQGSEESRFPADDVTQEKAEAYLRAAIGDDDVGFQIHQLSTWDAVADVPEKLREGNVFLAGDAAHRMPPSGGFGGNTGVQDAHNLAWKLALVLKGQAGEGLLSTYEEERLPIAELTVGNVFAHYVHRTEPTLAPLVEEHKITEVPIEHLELGYRYPQSRAVVTDQLLEIDGEGLTEDPAIAIARAGSVAYHVLVSTAEAREVPISHFFGPHFNLFVHVEDQTWGRILDEIRSSNSTVPVIEVVKLDYKDNSTFATRYQVSNQGCVLVRPDGFVAFVSRDNGVANSRGSDMAAALKAILSH